MRSGSKEGFKQPES